MKSKIKKTKVLFLLTLLTIFLFSGILNSRFSKNFITKNNYLEFNEKNQIQIKQSGFWDLTENPIYIDDLATGVGAHNWTWAETQPWCSGSGSWAYPYVIENVTINGQGSGNCIEVRNSAAYFIIRNCSLYNFGFSNNAGTKLDNVDNGKIINTTCKNNFFGIFLDESNNNTLSGNNANYNYQGICLWDSNNTMISGNNASNNNNYGIDLMISDDNMISGNIANNNYGGIYLSNSDNNTLSGNNASNNNYEGMYLSNCVNNTLSGNTANNNTSGISLDHSNNSTLSGNLMKFCGIYLFGSLVEVASHSIDKTNLVNNKQVYYYVNKTVLGSNNFTDAGQIILINCNNLIISELDSSGIHLYYCVNNTISGNTANNNTIGIYLYYCVNNTISGNNANSNTGGIYLWYSDNNTISGNNASNSDYYGIVLLGSNNNTISGNNASNSDLFGIYLYYSDNNTFSGNNANNNDNGIYLSYCVNNTLSGNTISNNSNGTRLDSNCNNNKIFLNNFINNGLNAEDNGTDNEWDNGLIGNYWDDYAGVDANDDGIGDTPYIISGTAGSQDNFPIWTDGDDITPIITIIFPLPDSIFGLDAPSYSISIDELNLDTIWYTLDGGGTNYTITGLTGTFNQLAWGALSEGSLTIRFYASDTAGNIGSAAVTVKKDTAPVITIIFPLPDSVFDLVAPNYNISIDELNLDTIWYTLDGGITNYTITALSGTFNQLAWGALNEGSLTIRFYANDTGGNIGFIDIEVIIEIPEDLPIISFGNYYILFTFITMAILSFIILEKRKKK